MCSTTVPLRNKIKSTIMDSFIEITLKGKRCYPTCTRRSYLRNVTKVVICRQKRHHFSVSTYGWFHFSVFGENNKSIISFACSFLTIWSSFVEIEDDKMELCHKDDLMHFHCLIGISNDTVWSTKIIGNQYV